MINITLKDKTVKQYENGVTALQIASDISKGLAKACLAAKINDKIMDMNTPITEDASVTFFTFDDEEGRNAYRHTTSHILAQAVKRLYSDAKLAIGPSIEKGFYYDFDVEKPFTAEDLLNIEKEMKKIIEENIPLQRIVMSREDALKYMNNVNEPYKVELICELPEDAQITFYKQGEFIDLCAGPHLVSTGRVKAFKLLYAAGAYWRGNEKNKMLQRIYGTAFDNKKDLDEYLERLEEAKKRDHNKLGRELGLFCTDEVIGQGLPLLMPKGAKMLQILQRFVEDEEEKRGYVLTRTPYIAKKDLYQISGHWEHYKEKMFILGDEEKDEEIFALRPMTCPYQFMIYKQGLKSYRDLPVRYAETSPLFRKEASGEMHGLIRVRQFTLSDGHILCTPEQLESEFKAVVNLTDYMLEILGLKQDVWYRFSKWDPDNKEKYIDNPKAWEDTQIKMKNILDRLGIKYEEADGEAAFYGPKLDVQVENVHGKEDTIITIQIDFALSEKFDLLYVDKDGEKKHPYIIHRSSIGCYERTMAMLIEKYAGKFPLWMCPEQVRILPLIDKHHDYAYALKVELESLGIRATIDVRNEKIGYKIREARNERIPYMFVIGDKEVEEDSVSVRSSKEGELGMISKDIIIKRLLDEIDKKMQ